MFVEILKPEPPTISTHELSGGVVSKSEFATVARVEHNGAILQAVEVTPTSIVLVTKSLMVEVAVLVTKTSTYCVDAAATVTPFYPSALVC